MFSRLLEETDKFFAPLNPVHMLKTFKHPASPLLPEQSRTPEQTPLVQTSTPPVIPPRPSKASINIVVPEKKVERRQKVKTQV